MCGCLISRTFFGNAKNHLKSTEFKTQKTSIKFIRKRKGATEIVTPFLFD